MLYLIHLTLPETHEVRRQRILAAALSQLTIHADAEHVSEELGFRTTRGSTAPNEIFRLLKVRIPTPVDLSSAITLANDATRAANSALRAMGLLHVQIHIFVLAEAGEQKD